MATDNVAQPLLGSRPKPTLQPHVPQWLYVETVNIGFTSLTKAAFMWWSNMAGMLFHLTLAIVTVIVAYQSGEGMHTPQLRLYLTNLTWVASLNASEFGTSEEFEDIGLHPQNVRVEGPYLAHMTLWFFLLSAIAHGLVVCLNYKQAGITKWDDISEVEIAVTRWTGWYYVWIHECRQPLRSACMHAHTPFLVDQSYRIQMSEQLRCACVQVAGVQHECINHD